MHRVVAATSIALLALTGCRSTPPAARPPARSDAGAMIRGPAVVLRPGGGRPPVTLRVEVARTEAVRNRGLMYRRELADDRGMLFVFARPGHYAFWMRNTLISLDMIFIGADRRVVGVARNTTPETDDPCEVPGEWLYVLEVNGGLAARWGLRAGDLVEMHGVEPAFE